MCALCSVEKFCSWFIIKKVLPLSAFVFIIVLVWHFHPSSLTIFILQEHSSNRLPPPRTLSMYFTMTNLQIWSPKTDKEEKRTLIMNFFFLDSCDNLFVNPWWVQVLMRNSTNPPYLTTYTHKTFRWCSWSWWRSKVSGHGWNSSLSPTLSQSTRPNFIFDRGSRHFRPHMWRLQSFTIFVCSFTLFV